MDIAFENGQYKLLYTISNNVEVYEELVTRMKNIRLYVVKFEARSVRRIELYTKVCTVPSLPDLCFLESFAFALIFTDFPIGSGSQPGAMLEICEYQRHP